MIVNDRISYDQFRELMDGVTELRDRALFSLIYVSCARVGEVVRNNVTCSKNPPLNKGNLEFTNSHLIVTVLTEKTNKYRRVPSSRAIEGWLHENILTWMVQCGHELFPYSTRWAEYRFEKCFGTGHIHLLRHWSCTHALQGKRTKKMLQPYEVAQLGGWQDLNTFNKTYSHLIVEDFIHRI